MISLDVVMEFHSSNIFRILMVRCLFYFKYLCFFCFLCYLQTRMISNQISIINTSNLEEREANEHTKISTKANGSFAEKPFAEKCSRIYEFCLYCVTV